MADYFRELLGQEPVIPSAVQEASTANTGEAPPAADGSEVNVQFTAASEVFGD